MRMKYLTLTLERATEAFAHCLIGLDVCKRSIDGLMVQ